MNARNTICFVSSHESIMRICTSFDKDGKNCITIAGIQTLRIVKANVEVGT